MYEAHTKREQVDRASKERFAYISGLLANTNLDDSKGSKRTTLESVDNSYYDTLKNIYNNVIDKKKEIDFENDPFFKAIKIPGRDIPVVDENDNIITPVPHDEKLESKYDVDIDQQ